MYELVIYFTVSISKYEISKLKSGTRADRNTSHVRGKPHSNLLEEWGMG